MASRQFEAALCWPPKILSSHSGHRGATPSAPPEVIVSLGGWRWLACDRVVGADLGAARWAFGGLGAIFLAGGMQPGGHAMFWSTEDLLLFRTFVRKGASKFGNWERVESDCKPRTESQDSDPGILKGPSKGWRRLRSMGRLGSRHPTPALGHGPWPRGAST